MAQLSSPSYILSPNFHLVMAWPFGIRKKNFMPWYQQQLSLHSHEKHLQSHKPYFLLTIPQVFFYLSKKSDSLTRGVHGKSEQLMMWGNVHCKN